MALSFLWETANILKWRLRNIFMDPFYIVYWDILPRLKRKRHLEDTKFGGGEIKIPITILTYKRPLYFEKTLGSFIKLNKANLESFLIIVFVQGVKDQKTEEVIDRYRNHIHDIIYPASNLGCAGGYSALMKEVIKLNLPYIVYLQDDFISFEPLSNYVSELIAFMEANEEIGFIRLRSIRDKVKNYNTISRRKIKYKKVLGNVGIGNAHFTFNPTIARSSIIERLIPTNSEEDAMKKYQRIGLKSGQLFAQCFSHIGHERVRDWIK